MAIFWNEDGRNRCECGSDLFIKADEIHLLGNKVDGYTEEKVRESYRCAVCGKVLCTIQGIS